MPDAIPPFGQLWKRIGDSKKKATYKVNQGEQTATAARPASRLLVT
jgi:hypothetical protein